jgi:hypothetical protein
MVLVTSASGFDLGNALLELPEEFGKGDSTEAQQFN